MVLQNILKSHQEGTKNHNPQSDVPFHNMIQTVILQVEGEEIICHYANLTILLISSFQKLIFLFQNPSIIITNLFHTFNKCKNLY